MNATMFILLVVIMIPVFLTLIFTPYLTRRTESFGVSIPEAIYYSSKLKSMRKGYAMSIAILSLLVMMVFLFMASYFENEETISIIFSIILGVFMMGSFFVYLRFHRAMKKLKELENWSEKKSQMVIVETGFRNQKLTYSNLWFIFSFIIAFASMFITFRFYDQIPDRIPMQYDFDGDVTNWADKSYRTLMMMPIMQVYLTLLFLLINTMIGKSKQQVNTENPEDSLRKNVTFRRRWSAYIIITGIATTLLFSITQLSFIFKINQAIIVIAPLVLTIGITVGAIVLAFTTGQGGSRVKTSGGQNGNVIDRDDDRYWKLGMLYYNRNDPAVFLEKRFGIGWTNNWAHPLSWLFIIVVIAGAVGIPILLGE